MTLTAYHLRRQGRLDVALTHLRSELCLLDGDEECQLARQSIDEHTALEDDLAQDLKSALLEIVDKIAERGDSYKEEPAA